MQQHSASSGRFLRTLVYAAASVLPIAGAIAADPFPTQPVKLVLGLPAGSSADVVARTVAQSMESTLGQAVVVENRVGAGGTLATTAVASARADGHTVNASGCSGDAVVQAYLSSGRPPLVPFKDLVPVGRLMRDHWLVVVSPSIGVSTLEQLRTFALSSSAPVAFPSQGEGSTPHLQGERLARALAIKSLHVPYKDSSISDLVGGRLSFSVVSSAGAIELVRSGRLKALAVLSRERLVALPEVPTANEAGLPGYFFNGAVCLWVPGATPIAVQERLNKALSDAASTPAVRERMQSLGVEPVTANLAETARFVAEFMQETDKLRQSVFGPPR